MAPRSAERNGSARVAVVGAESPAGTLIRGVLARRKVPGSRVDLYGRTRGEAVISEYDGEARLIQDPDPAEVAGHEVIFLCEAGDWDAQRAAANEPDALWIDLVHGARGAERAPLVLQAIQVDTVRREQRVLAVPHPIGLLLTELLHPLERSFGVENATAVVLCPAADHGDAGIEELRQQTVQLLNFSRGPREVFGSQLAFNLIPQSALPGSEPELESRIVGEVQRLLGWRDPRLALRLIHVPVFYGHSVNLRVGLGAPADAAALRQALATSTRLRAAGEPALRMPIEATGETRTSVSEIVEDGLGGFWLWAVSGEAAVAAAENAVDVAAAASDLV